MAHLSQACGRYAAHIAHSKNCDIHRRTCYIGLAIGPNISATVQLSLENSGVPLFNPVWKHEQGISKSKKTESIRRINNPKATGSEPLRKLEPRLSCYECRQSRLRIKPLRNVGTRFVDNNRNVVSLGNQLAVATLDDFAVVLFRLDHEQKLVHESSHPPRGTRLA